MNMGKVLYICSKIIIELCRTINKNVMLKRLKAALAEQGKTNRRLSEQLGKSENTVSRWCANKVQPSIQQLNEIASVLDVDIRNLITPTK